MPFLIYQGRKPAMICHGQKDFNAVRLFKYRVELHSYTVDGAEPDFDVHAAFLPPITQPLQFEPQNVEESMTVDQIHEWIISSAQGQLVGSVATHTPTGFNSPPIVNSPCTSFDFPLTAVLHSNSSALDLSGQDAPFSPDLEMALPPSVQMILHSQPDMLHSLPVHGPAPGRGSLAAMRLLVNTVTPAAVFIGLVGATLTGQRNFFEPHVPLPSIPSLSDILEALQSAGGSASNAIITLCQTLDATPCTISWSRQLVEVTIDALHTSVLTGYREVGALGDHLHASPVLIDAAQPNEASAATLEVHDLDSRHRLYVLYITATTLAPARRDGVAGDSGRELGSFLPRPLPPAGRRSRSQTPAPSKSGLGSESLRRLLRSSTWLDEHYLSEGVAYSLLVTRGFGAAYLQVRQMLKIDNLFKRIKATDPTTTLTVQDVAAWAGIYPLTYINNRTWVTNARATLQFLRSSPRPQDQALQHRLGIFFSAHELGENWWMGDAASLDAVGATVTGVKTSIVGFSAAQIASYKHQPFDTC
ncbi:hypothetical protein B0H19DRAFT_1085154 [Mycena capillaripes]|nr:hypothetical protein B0H19DRAFT_1085151 [Mycena capillaripes]KAJ6524765.1 hypothetical protein B0H19DRAFT_1085154 [Mycena capillaripes]